MKQTISLKEALFIMDRVDKLGNAIAFDISFRSLNRRSKTGGKLYQYKGVKKIIAKKGLNTKSRLKAKVLSSDSIKRNPNHFENRTRNIELQNGEIKKIHIRLIISINGKKVIY